VVEANRPRVQSLNMLVVERYSNDRNNPN